MSDAVSRPVRVDARTLALVALLAFAASAPSLANGFAYDDRWIIESNNRVHDLHRWADWFRTSYWPTQEGSLYRPLTTMGFALQWVAAHGAPWVFHVVNVALYVAGAVAFTWLASLLLPATAALIVGALFAVHPVHVEAVANVVGQSELSAGLVMLLAMVVYIRARRRGALDRQTTWLLGALYLVGMMLKEHAMVLPAWFVAAEFTILRDGSTIRQRVRALLPAYTLLAALAACMLVVRWDILDAIGGDIPHPVVAELGIGGRFFVMLGVLPEMVRVLVWPAHLYADYSPAHIVVSSSPDVSQLNGVLIAVGAVVVTMVTWRRSAAAAFGVLIAAIVWLPTANILFPSGVLLAERTMYLPGAGLLLAVGAGVAWLEPRLRARPLAAKAVVGAAACLLLLGIVRSATRARAWRSSDEIFATMLREQPLSFRAHYAWGGVLFDRGDMAGGIREWRMAIRIYPEYHKLHQDLGGKFLSLHRCDVAMPLFRKAIELGGPLPLSRAGVVACELELARFSDARKTAYLGILDGHDPAWFRARLHSADSALAARDSIRR